jgi:hypothetical protein
MLFCPRMTYIIDTILQRFVVILILKVNTGRVLIDTLYVLVQECV